MRKPIIVCLCGSTRFYDAFQRANYEETMAGRIVLSVGFYPHSAEQAHGEAIGITPEQKIALDELHKRKIDLADEVYVLNVGGYIGASTRSEIDYALAHGKAIRYLENRTQTDVKIGQLGIWRTRFRDDGWPLCPFCGDDELWSSLNWDGQGDRPPVQAYIDAGLTCYACGPVLPPKPAHIDDR